MVNLFGWEISRTPKEIQDELELKSVTPDVNDGSIVVDNSSYMDYSYGDAYGTSMSFDIDPSIVSEHQLITKYREVAMVPEVEYAIDDIINEMVSSGDNELVQIDLDQVNFSDGLKNKITDEFKHVINMMDFNNKAFSILKRWYVDGRLHYQIVVNPATSKEVGIGKLTWIDPRLIKRVKVMDRTKDPRTGVDTFADLDEYFVFSSTGFGAAVNGQPGQSEQGVKIAKEAIAFTNSGLLDPTNSIVLSYLHKAIRPLNQLRNLEDASIIYRLSRAPERRVFYIDVGNLPPMKAEQVLKRQMQQYKTKMVYDAASGSVRSDTKQMAMTEDYYLARRGDGKSTEITTLPGGQNLGEMNEIEYFLNKLYKSLNVPVSRLSSEAGFNFGRVTEINRDELKFMKFVERLRSQFAEIFLMLLERQLALKNIVNPDEFKAVRNSITFEFKSDNVFEESKNAELLERRLDLVSKVHEYRGVYFSDEYIRREILQFSQEDMEEMDEQMADEEAAGVYENGTRSEMIQQQESEANIEASMLGAQAQVQAAKQPQIVQQTTAEPQSTTVKSSLAPAQGAKAGQP